MDILAALEKTTSMTTSQIKLVLQKVTLDGQFTIGQRLEEMNLKSSEEILRQLCNELELEYIKDINVFQINLDLIRDVSINYAKSHIVIPFKESSDEVHIITSNPIDTTSVNDLQIIYGKRVIPIISLKTNVQEYINKLYERSSSNLSGLDELEDSQDFDLEEQTVDLLDVGADDAPVIKLVNSLLFRAVKEKVSDIHLEPYEKDFVVRFRMDGVLSDVFRPPKKLQNAITSRIKVMANLNIAEKRLPQDGRISLKVGGKDIDIRLSTVPAANGERLVMRIQDRSNVVLELNKLGFAKENLKRINNILTRTDGIILVTGPTGSGKSTTLYGALSQLNSPEVNILTIEDPVEQRIQGLGQVQVNSKIGLTFASGLRSFLRQDPDIIMVGEIRDLETAELAIQASLTGHLVLSTLHTNDSAGAFPRLIDFGVEPFLIATSVAGVIAQRLVRVLCPNCKEVHIPTDIECSILEIKPNEKDQHPIYKAKGCSECGQRGYIGRTTISELLIVNDAVRSLIMQRKDGNSIKKEAVQSGMKTFREHGIEKVLDGVTTIEELTTNTQLDI